MEHTERRPDCVNTTTRNIKRLEKPSETFYGNSGGDEHMQTPKIYHENETPKRCVGETSADCEAKQSRVQSVDGGRRVGAFYERGRKKKNSK